MSKQIIDHGFGIIETRETFYTEETISKLNQQIAELQKQLAVKDKALELTLSILRYKTRRDEIKAIYRKVEENIKGTDLMIDNEIKNWLIEQAEKELEDE